MSVNYQLYSLTVFHILCRINIEKKVAPERYVLEYEVRAFFFVVVVVLFYFVFLKERA